MIFYQAWQWRKVGHHTIRGKEGDDINLARTDVRKYVLKVETYYRVIEGRIVKDDRASFYGKSDDCPSHWDVRETM